MWSGICATKSPRMKIKASGAWNRRRNRPGISETCQCIADSGAMAVLGGRHVFLRASDWPVRTRATAEQRRWSVDGVVKTCNFTCRKRTKGERMDLALVEPSMAHAQWSRIQWSPSYSMAPSTASARIAGGERRPEKLARISQAAHPLEFLARPS